MPGRYEKIRIERDSELLWVMFNRPDVYNAFDLGQWREVTAALQEAENDVEVRAVALRGAGQNFSAGYDLKAAIDHLADASPNMWRDYIAVGNETCWTVWNLKKPVIAAVEGYCLGGAFELAMACDFVIASQDAVFGEPEIRLSDAPPFLISPWVMGMRQAKDLLLTGDLIPAEKAMAFGILTSLCPQEELDEQVRRLAGKLAGFAVETWHLNKAAINRSYELMGFHTAIDMGAEAFATTNTTINDLKREFLERFQRDGLGAALAWARRRYEGDDPSAGDTNRSRAE
jgi:enoyl-CoA hydratase